MNHFRLDYRNNKNNNVNMVETMLLHTAPERVKMSWTQEREMERERQRAFPPGMKNVMQVHNWFGYKMVITDKDEAMEISTENCQLVMRPEKKNPRAKYRTWKIQRWKRWMMRQNQTSPFNTHNNIRTQNIVQHTLEFELVGTSRKRPSK